MQEQPISLPSQSFEQEHTIDSNLAAILSDLLGIAVSEIDADTNFLEFGADSFLTLLFSRSIQDTFGVTIPFRLILEEYSTIRDLTKYIIQKLPLKEHLPVSERPQQQTADRETSISQLNEPISTGPQRQISGGGSLGVDLTDWEVPQSARVDPGLYSHMKEDHPASVHHHQISHQPFSLSAGYRANGREDHMEDGYSQIQTGIESIITQQLQIMSQQLEVLQNKVTGVEKPPRAREEPFPGVKTSVQGTYEAQRIAEVKRQSAPDVREPSGQAISSSNNKEIFVPYQSNSRITSKSLTLDQQQHIEALAARLNQRTQKSKDYTQTYRPFMADSKTSAGFTPVLKEMVYPIIFPRGANATIWDLDGNEYIDLAMGVGSLLFGHSPSFVMQALEEQVNLGLRSALQSDVVGKVAELLCKLTSMERVFFCNSGTEAVMTALCLARAVTERTKIVAFEGSHHGAFDGVLASRQETHNGEISIAPLEPGISPLQYLKAHAHELAAVLVEPVQSQRPDFLPVEFLRDLRQLTEESGVALIFDEVITGFRSHPGGVQAMLGIQADLTIYGRALGSGMPIGAIAGRAVFMDAIDGGMWNYGDGSFPQAPQTCIIGTYFKHSFVIGVVWAVLNYLREEGSKIQQQLNQRTSQLVETLNSYFTQEELPIRIVHFSSLFRFSFSSGTNPIDIHVFFYHLLEKGIYIGEACNCFLSTAHTEQEIASFVQAVKESAAEMRAGGFFTSSSPSISEHA